MDDICAQLGCLDRGLCTRDDNDIHCGRETAVAAGAARPYSLRLAVFRWMLRKCGLGRLCPQEAREW